LRKFNTRTIDQRVWINPKQFSLACKSGLEFHVGGYQVCENGSKTKDELTYEDIQLTKRPSLPEMKRFV